MIDYNKKDTSKTLKPLRNNLILFGPPGIGKSTIIKLLRESGIPAFDLEWLPDLQSRMEFIRTHTGFILGGADVNPKQPIKHSFKLLLIMDQHKYVERRKIRDENYPSKAAQRAHSMSEWTFRCDERYHFTLNVNNSDVRKAAKGVLERARRVNIFSSKVEDIARELCSSWAHV